MFFKKSRGVHISEHHGHKEMSLKNPLVRYLSPEYVYIPLVEQNAPCECLVKANDHVKIGDVIAMKTGRFSSPIHSSVSGEVIATDVKMWHSSGKMVPTIQIKNDHKEKWWQEMKANDVEKMTREEMIELVKNCGIVGLGGSGFPTYVKYIGNSPINVVIINAVECEPYISDDYFTIQWKFEDIIRGIKYIMKMTDAPKAIIAVKKTRKVIIEHMTELLQDEPNITLHLLKDEYPAGWERYIVHHIIGKDYRNLPSEVGAVVQNVGTIAAITKAIEYSTPLVEKYLTITGPGLKNPTNVKAKIGTKLNEIIESIGGYIDDLGEAYFIAGGPMTGKAIFFDSMVVNRSLTSIVVLPKRENDFTIHCMGCGKCAEKCPSFLSPIQIKNAFESKDIALLKALRTDKCMQCGLCSYMCPSRIELTEAVGKAKDFVLKSGK